MSFRWPGYRDLKQQLGELGAASQLVEVAVQEMLASGAATGDSAAHVQSLAVKHSNTVNAQDPGVVRGHVARLYIVTVNSALERYLRDLWEHHPNWKRLGAGSSASSRAKRSSIFLPLAISLAAVSRRFARPVRSA